MILKRGIYRKMETLSYNKLYEILRIQYEEEIREANERRRRGEGVVMDKIVDFMKTPTSENLGGVIGEGIRSMNRDRELEEERRRRDDGSGYIYLSRNYM